jgi:tellurite resistance protein TerC
MYFAVSRLMKLFRFLRYGLAAMLVLVGLKMLTADYYQIPTAVMLGAVAGLILISIAISAIFPAPNKA